MRGTRKADRHKRWATAWAVAYILVLQAFLSSLAIAAMPLGGENTLCVSSQPPGHQGETDPASAEHVHCEACLARADVPDLPPPLQLPTVDRIAIELAFDTAVRTGLRRTALPQAFQPRGPPAFLSS